MRKEIRNVYIAKDGKEFDNREECISYENLGLGELASTRNALVYDVVTLERRIQFEKSRCNSGQCTKYMHREMVKAKKLLFEALGKKKTYKNIKDIREKASNYIHAIDNYRFVVKEFTNNRSALRKYHKLLKLVEECKTMDEYREKKEKLDLS